MVIAKMKDQSGASLPLALFLFMVCTLLASVVLAAGSVAIGQHASQMKAEQGYYSVSSAAKLVSDALDGKGAEISVSKTTTVTDTIVHGREGEAVTKTTTSTPATYTITLNGRESYASDQTILETALLDSLGVNDGLADAESLWEDDFEFSGTTPSPTRMTVEHSITQVPEGYRAGTLENALLVDVMERPDGAGNIVFTFSSPEGTDDPYSLDLTMEADCLLDESVSETAPVITQNGQTRTEVRTVTQTKTLHASWKTVNIVRTSD